MGMKQVMQTLGLGIAIGAAVAFATSTWAAGTYKWIDDQGVVHYSDKAPPDVPPKGESVLDKQGREVQKIEPPLTPSQLKAKAEDDERQRVVTKAKDDQARRDRALMQSYSNEDEIEIARTRAVSTIDAQIKSAQAFSTDLTARQQILTRKKASYGSKPIPVELDHEFAAIDAELSRQAILVRQKQEELAQTTTKYDTIKQRWHEILADQERAAAAEAQAAADKAGRGAGKQPAAGSTAAK